MKTPVLWISCICLTFGISARAAELVVPDTDAMEKAADAAGAPTAVLDYETVDQESGNPSQSGSVEIHDGGSPDQVTVVTKDDQGRIKVVKTEKKTYVPSEFGEGYSWWDVGFGMFAGSLGSKLVEPAGGAPGRQLLNYNGVGGIDISFSVRPRIVQQRFTASGDMMMNGCNGPLNNYISSPGTSTTIESGVNCHVAKEASADFAAIRTGRGDGIHHEIAFGASFLTFDVDHADPLTDTQNAFGLQPGKTKQELILPSVTYRLWTGHWIHPEVKAEVGQGTAIVHFTLRWSTKKHINALGQSQYDIE